MKSGMSVRVFVLAALVAVGCGGSSAPAVCDVGSEGCPCTAGGGCDGTLACRSNTCVNIGGAAGAAGQIGAAGASSGSAGAAGPGAAGSTPGAAGAPGIAGTGAGGSGAPTAGAGGGSGAGSSGAAGATGPVLTCLDKPSLCDPLTQVCYYTSPGAKPFCATICPNGCNTGTHCVTNGVPGSAIEPGVCRTGSTQPCSDIRPSRRECDGICIDTGSDWRNCGGCGAVCPAGATCMQGKCFDGSKTVSPKWPACPAMSTNTISCHGLTYYGSACYGCRGVDPAAMPCTQGGSLCITDSITGSCSCP